MRALYLGQRSTLKEVAREKKSNLNGLKEEIKKLWAHFPEKAGLAFRHGLIQALNIIKTGLYLCLSTVLALCGPSLPTDLSMG